MPTVTIHIGYQDTTNPAIDVRQRRWTVDAIGHRWWTCTVDVDEVPKLERIADAVYAADNDPMPLPAESLETKIRIAMTRACASADHRHHSLSVGDRVRVGPEFLVCAPAGWVHHWWPEPTVRDDDSDPSRWRIDSDPNRIDS